MATESVGGGSIFGFDRLVRDATRWAGGGSRGGGTGDPLVDGILAELGGMAQQGGGGATRSGGGGGVSLASMLPSWARDLKLVDRQNIPRNMDGSISADFSGFLWAGRTKGTPSVTIPDQSEPDFMGGMTRSEGTTTIPGKPRRGKAVTAEGAFNRIYSWDEEDVVAAIDRLNDLGYEVSGFSDLEQIWGMAIDRASKTFMATEGERKLSPWDVLEMGAREAGLSPAVAGDTNGDGKLGPGDAGYDGKQVQVSKSITDVSEGQAWSVLRGTVSQMLGRDPSDNELRDFTYRMGKAAASNPSISRTVTQYEDGDAVSQTTRSKTGFTMDDAAMAAYEDAQNNADYAEYQSATTYFNALMSGLGPIGG